jgi:hypothetical protein
MIALTSRFMNGGKLHQMLNLWERDAPLKFNNLEFQKDRIIFEEGLRFLARHASLPNPRFRHVVLTCPETAPCMLFLFPGSGPGQAWLLALPGSLSRLFGGASPGRFLTVPLLPPASTYVNDINH